MGEILRKENTGAASVHVGLANLGGNLGTSLVQPVELAVLGIHRDGNRSTNSLVSPVIAQDRHPLLSLPVHPDQLDGGGLLVGDVQVATHPVEGDGVGRPHHAGVELVEEVDLVSTAHIGDVEGPVVVVLVVRLHPVDLLLLLVVVQAPPVLEVHDGGDVTPVGLVLGRHTDIHYLRLLHHHQVRIVLLDTVPDLLDQTEAWPTLADESLLTGGREETDVVTVVVLARVGQPGLQHGVVDVDREGLRHQLGHDTLVTSSELPGLK